MGEVKQLLESVAAGNPLAASELLPLVYEELRRIAASKMGRESPHHTLQPTALVHEAWLRMVRTSSARFEGRAQFFAVAAEAMRRILVESARRKLSLKRGQLPVREDLDESLLLQQAPSEEMLAVHEALDRLADYDSSAAELVKLRYFVGMTMDEAATALALPLRSAERLWAFARAWLRQEITGGPRD